MNAVQIFRLKKNFLTKSNNFEVDLKTCNSMLFDRFSGRKSFEFVNVFVMHVVS